MRLRGTWTSLALGQLTPVVMVPATSFRGFCASVPDLGAGRGFPQFLGPGPGGGPCDDRHTRVRDQQQLLTHVSRDRVGSLDRLRRTDVRVHRSPSGRPQPGYVRGRSGVREKPSVTEEEQVGKRKTLVSDLNHLHGDASE